MTNTNHEPDPPETGFGVTSGFTPAEKIDRAITGTGPRLTKVQRKRLRDPKEASAKDMGVFFLALGQQLLG